MLYALAALWLVSVLTLSTALVLTIAVQAAGRLLQARRSPAAAPAAHREHPHDAEERDPISSAA